MFETRLALVSWDLKGPINYNTCSNNQFLTEAENQGTVFSLQGAEKYIQSGELSQYVQQEEAKGNYVYPRFIHIAEDYFGRPYCVESCTDSLGQRLDVFDIVYVKSDKRKTKYEIIASTSDHEGNEVFVVRENRGRTTARYYPKDLVRIE